MPPPMTDIKKLAAKLGTDGPVKTLPTPRTVKALFGGVYIIVTARAQFVWEHPYYPQFYVPRADLDAQSKNRSFKIEEVESIKNDGNDKIATQLKISVASSGKSTEQVVAFAENLKSDAEKLNGLVKLDFASMDQWFEEDTPIHVHPKDPFKRVDVLQSNRPVTVNVDGVQIAETSTAMHLYETGLPCRFYIPLTAIDPAVLRPSDTSTKCPYKGIAEYYNVEVNGTVHEDLFWYYRAPTLECAKVEGLCCPYNERCDITLDGKLLERPKTPFGKPKQMKPPSAV